MKFKKIGVDVHIVEYLTKVGVLNASTATVLSVAEKRGGYVAGGFALELYKFVMNGGLATAETKTLNKQIRDQYLGTCIDIKGLTTGESPSPFSHYGDIDVWFPTVESHNEFLHDVKEVIEGLSLSVYTEASVTGFATNLFCFRDAGVGGQKVQVIKKYCGETDQLLKTFDITNAMVAFHGSEFTVHEQIDTLYKNNSVDVNDDSYLFDAKGVFRLKRWMTRHGLTGLSAEAAELLNKNIGLYVDSVVLEHKELPDKGMYLYAQEYENYVPSFKTSSILAFLRYITIGNLLKLSLIYNRKDNPAMNEIIKRQTIALSNNGAQ